MNYFKNYYSLTPVLYFFKERIVAASLFSRLLSSFFLPLLGAVAWYIFCYSSCGRFIDRSTQQYEALCRAKEALSKKVIHAHRTRGREEYLGAAVNAYSWSDVGEKRLLLASLRSLSVQYNLCMYAYEDISYAQGKLPFVVVLQRYSERILYRSYLFLSGARAAMGQDFLYCVKV